MSKEQKTALVWFRNDLRATDNESLRQARLTYDHIIGVYCFDPRHYQTTPYGFKKTERYRARFLLESVADLHDKLKSVNIPLVVQIAKPEEVLPLLIEKYGIRAIYCQKEWTSDEVSVTKAVTGSLSQQCELHEIYDQFLYHPHDCPIPISSIPKVFTNFRKQCEKNATVREATGMETPCSKLVVEEANEQLPGMQDLGFVDFETDSRSAFPFQGGETAAQRRLEDYFFGTKKLGVYKKTRNGLVGTDYSSKFSPWLANGSISARQIYWAVKRFEKEHYKNQSTYWLVFELIWRDFFKYISLKYGNKIFHLGGILNKLYHWDNSPVRFNRWTEGKTAEDFVNANMIELRETGWMSNRGRQNVASYLARDMNMDWRMGAAYFESMLIDYDVHSNYGNWMYVAGVGNDPRDRKFNVGLQAERYDPRAKFQNTWLQASLF